MFLHKHALMQFSPAESSQTLTKSNAGTVKARQQCDRLRAESVARLTVNKPVKSDICFQSSPLSSLQQLPWKPQCHFPPLFGPLDMLKAFSESWCIKPASPTVRAGFYAGCVNICATLCVCLCASVCVQRASVCDVERGHLVLCSTFMELAWTASCQQSRGGRRPVGNRHQMLINTYTYTDIYIVRGVHLIISGLYHEDLSLVISLAGT